MNENWCGSDDCPHCQGHEYGPEGSPDCPKFRDDKTVMSHSVIREVELQTVKYECVLCGLKSNKVSDFERYGCNNDRR